MQTQHVPVMLEEVLKYLQPEPGGHYIDGTLGGGGHTAAILERSTPGGKVLGIDTDTQALERVRERFPRMVEEGRLVLVHGNFAEMARIANEAGFLSVQGVLLDLGFSSDQMESAERGFSFGAEGPLDMRLDQTQELTAADLINTLSEQELADIFWRYGEEKRSRQIARRIVREREKGAIRTTARLAALAAAGVPYKYGAIHPATRVFQALRIAVNRELEQLEAALPQALDVLTASAVSAGEQESGSGSGEKRAGRLVVIAFHSLEDRLVKEFMRREGRDCICPPGTPVCVCGHTARVRVLTRKPVMPTAEEVMANPRARSARLRAAETVVGS